MEKKRKSWLLTLIFLAAMLGAGYLQIQYDTHNDYFRKRETFLTLPSGKTLRILSFGFKNLVADMLFIWSIQFYSNYNLTNSYDYLARVYDTITDITPSYKEPYIVGSWIMSLEAKNPQMAIDLLQKGARNMPKEWIFDHECGFYAYKNLKDYKLAEKFFARAAANPSAPAYIKRQKAHMIYLEDNLELAYKLWTEIYNTATDQMEKTSATNHLQQIKFELDKKLISQRIQRFKELFNRIPRNLNELMRAGLLAEIPRDFDGDEYIYDQQTGEISAQKVFRWKK